MDSVEYCRQRLITLWDGWRASGGTQVTLAAACGVAQGQISLWLKDLKAGVVPRVQSLEVLCRGFDVPVASLFPPAPGAAVDPALLALFTRLASDPVMAPILRTQLERLVGQQAEMKHRG